MSLDQDDSLLDQDDSLLNALVSKCLVGGGWKLLTIALGLCVALARTFVVARLVGPEAFGVMTMALLVLATGEALTATGTEAALVSHPDDPLADVDPAFTLQAIRGLLVAIVVWLAAPWIASFFGTSGAAGVVRAIGAIALLRGLGNPGVALFIKRLEFGRLFWWSVPEVVTGFVLAVGFAAIRRDVWALVIGSLGQQAVATVATHLLAPRLPRPTFRREGFRRLIHYGKWINGSVTLSWISVMSDRAIVGKILGPSALGLYQLAVRLGELAITLFTSSFAQVAFPALSQLQADPRRLKRGYRALLRLELGVNGAFAIFVILLGGPLVGWLLGPNWMPMVPALRIVAVAMVFRTVLMVSNQLFNAVRQPARIFPVHVARIAVLLATIVPLTRAFGMQGAATSVLLSNVAAAGMSLRQVRGLEELRKAA